MERTHIRELRYAAPPALCSVRLNAPVQQSTIQRRALSTERLQWRSWPKILAGAGFTSILNGANAKSTFARWP